MCGKLRKFHLVVCVNGNIFFLAPPWTPMTPDMSSWAIVSLLLFNIFCMMRAQMFELKILGCGGMFMRVASRCNYYFSPRQPLPTSICKATLNLISEAILYIWKIQRHFSRLWLLIPNNLNLCGNVDPYLSVFIILRHLWCVWSLAKVQNNLNPEHINLWCNLHIQNIFNSENTFPCFQYCQVFCLKLWKFAR